MFDGAMLYRVVHYVPSTLFLHKSIMGLVRTTFVVTHTAN